MVDPLPPHPTFERRPGPLVLCILDGVGLGLGEEDDAVATANTPNLDRLMAEHPWRKLRAHGPWAGLPSDGDMGNSEVGHNAMGAGRVFDQGAKLVDRAIASGSAFASDAWRELIAGNTLHLLGLVSDGNVHSHIDHLNALIDRAAADGVQRLRVHVLTDGRDVEARSALTWVEPLEAKLAAMSGDYRIGSGGGRMLITMDRYEADWDMVKRGWDCHVHGQGRPFSSASEAIRTLYAEDERIDDQWLPAFVIVDQDGPVGTIETGDSVLFFNFRGDRALEISRAFDRDVPFDRGDRPTVTYAGMMQYDGDLLIPDRYLVSPPDIDRTAAEFLAAARLPSLACSETHKFGHVTYFFNGNRSEKFDPTVEDWIEVKSRNVVIDEAPEMEAEGITTAAVAAIESGKYAHIRLNYANGDMVGHTGNLAATRTAVEVVDDAVGQLAEAVRQADGVLLVTADHGNADEMYMRKNGQVRTDSKGRPIPKTSHTLNPVPFILYDPRGDWTIADPDSDRGLASIATTLLELCGLQAPSDYVPGLVEAR